MCDRRSADRGYERTRYAARADSGMTEWPQWLAGTGLVTIGRHDPVGQGHDPEGRHWSSPQPLWSAIDRARGSVAPTPRGL